MGWKEQVNKKQAKWYKMEFIPLPQTSEIFTVAEQVHES